MIRYTFSAEAFIGAFADRSALPLRRQDEGERTCEDLWRYEDHSQTEGALGCFATNETDREAW